MRAKEFRFRWTDRGLVVRFVSVSFGLIFLVASSGCARLPFVESIFVAEEERMTRAADEAIKNSPKLQELDRFCNGIPRPADFEVKGKSKGFTKKALLTYGYNSGMAPKEVRNFFYGVASERGWKELEGSSGWKIESIKFDGGQYVIGIDLKHQNDGVRYLISCAAPPE